MDQMDQLQTCLEALEQQMHTVNRRLRWWRGLAGGLLVLAVLTWALPLSTAQEGARSGEKGLAQRVAALEDLLQHFSRDGDEVFITGANLHIVNAIGSTNCIDEQGEQVPDCPNGLGNLIVGYNEPRFPEFGENIRTGSHNVVVGRANNFSSFGGLVVGLSNAISSEWATVTGRFNNTASGISASVSGGADNTASGINAAISGGADNTASGADSWVGGGFSNTSRGNGTAVSGGRLNTASGGLSSVSGGNGITVEQGDAWAAGSFGGEVSGSFRSP